MARASVRPGRPRVRYAEPMSPTVADALARATAALAQVGAPRSDVDELLSRLLGTGRGEVRVETDRPLREADWRRLEEWLARRSEGEPVQYITGRAAFRDLDLSVGPAVLIPRPETEFLVEVVLEVLRRADSWPRPRVLDLGTGSGAIALAIARECPPAVVSASDSSEAALEFARSNAAASALEGRVRFLHGAWFSALPADERFEVVVSNPPYVSEREWDSLPPEVRREPRPALVSGEDGLEATRAIIEDAPFHLVTGGLLALEMDETRAAAVAGWLTGAHEWDEVEVRDDLAGRPRILLARRARGPAIAPLQWPEVS